MPVDLAPDLEAWLADLGARLDPQPQATPRPCLSGRSLQRELAVLRWQAERLAGLQLQGPADAVLIGVHCLGLCRGVAGGRDLQPGLGQLAFVLLPGESLALRFSTPRVDGLWLRLTLAQLRQECSLHGTSRPDFTSLVHTLAPQAAFLMVCGDQLLQQQNTRLQASLQASLLSLLASLVQPLPLEPSPDPHNRPEVVVSQAQAFMADQLAQPLDLAMLCDACGVSPRTLQLAFRSVHGCTPMQRLLHLRLQRLRELLLEGQTMQRACTAAGLNPSGRIAARYRELYGELPRQTKTTVS